MTGASVGSAGKGGEAVGKEVAGEAVEETSKIATKSATETIKNKTNVGGYEITEKLVENSEIDKTVGEVMMGMADSSLGADATLAQAQAKYDGTRFLTETTVTKTGAGMPAGVKETMNMPGNTYAEKLANKSD